MISAVRNSTVLLPAGSDVPAQGATVRFSWGALRASPDGNGSMSTATLRTGAILPGRGGVGGALSDAFWRNPKLLLFVMLTPPLLWLWHQSIWASLFALLVQSFFFESTNFPDWS